MNRVRRAILRVWNALRPSAREADLAREVASHLALLEDDFQRRGLSAGDARLAARRALGSTAHTMNLHRDARSFVWLDDVRWDVGYSARLLRRNPIFTLTAALSLAIGIGANTTIFTIANALLFRPPAGVAEPGRLVDIGRSVRRSNAFNPGSYPDYVDVRQRTTTLDGVYASAMFPHPKTFATAEGAGGEPVFALSVTLNYFSVLGVSPAAGRLFGTGDSEQPGASPIVVLSHRFWTRRFAQSRDVIGRAVRIDGQPLTVVGVASEGFQGTGVRTSDVWIPITMPSADGSTSLFTNRAAGLVIMGGRLKPDASVDAAAAEIETIGRELEREHPEENKDKGLRALAASPVPGNAGAIAAFLALLMGIVSTVLVVACTNLAGVLLARATARRREIAIRLAIGAGRSRLVRQLLTETIMLFAIGGAAGLALARVMTSTLVVRLPALPFPIDMNLAIDGRAIALTSALSLAAALVCGLVPALQASKTDSVAGLRDEPQGPAGRSRVRHAFLVAQVALSIVLVVVAGLFVRALQHVSAGSPGFDPHGVEIASIDLASAGYTNATAPVFARELVDRVRRLPGVQAATIAAVLPGGFERISLAPIGAPGLTDAGGRQLFSADWNIVEPGYFSTLNMTIVSGRDFTDADRANGQPVAVIGSGAARRLFPGQEAVGKSIVEQPYSPPGRPEAPARTLLIVGVAKDPSYGTLFDGMSEMYVYVPLQQRYLGKFTNLVVRSAGGRPVTNEVRALVASMNPNVPIAASQSADDYTSLGLLPQRVAASVAGSLGMFGLVLAAIGIYGVTAYAVARRTREFGVRLALGATSGDIFRMVLGEGMRLAVAGSIVGLLLAAAAAQVLTSFLFGVKPIDPFAFAAAALLFAAIGLAACYVPARRATGVDPSIALRAE